MATPHRLILASQSPRRHELLTLIGIDFVAQPADVDETPVYGESPRDYVSRIARWKADTVVGLHRGAPDIVVLAADTTIELDGQIVVKPTDDDDARRILRTLSGREHLVHTAVVCQHVGVMAPVQEITVTTAVTFVQLSEADIEWYLATGEHADKAGAYGIQGAAGAFVERIDGSPSNVIGLPLAETRALLAVAGVL